MEIEGIIPAPYMARNRWVAIIEMDALRQPELKELIRNSYQLVLEKLPKRTQAGLRTGMRVKLSAKTPAKAGKTKPRRAGKRRK